MEETISLRAKLFLVGFGLTFGLIVGVIFLVWRKSLRSNTEFDSLSDLRKTMLGGEQGERDERGVTLRQIISPHPSDDLIYDLKPNLDVQFQRARVKTNSCGMRGGEVKIPKPPNTYRIVLLGDSFAFGWGVEDSQAFGRVLEANLNRMSDGKVHFELLNLAVPGYSTFQEVARLKEIGLDFQPDAVLLFWVENDFGLPFFVRDLSGSKGGLLSSLSFLQSRDDSLPPPPQYDPNRSILELGRIGKEHGIRVVMTMNPKKSAKRDKKKLWALNQETGIEFLELRKDFMNVVKTRSINPKDLSLTFDPHPSPLKHKILGDVLTPYFMGIIE